MKWLFLLGAVYVLFLARAPHVCDVESGQQCSIEEQRRIGYLQTKTKEELSLLLEMEVSERELAREQLMENLLYIKQEIERLQKNLETLDSLYKEQLVNYKEKIDYIQHEYRGDLTRRLLSSAQGKNEESLNRPEK